MYGIHDGSNKKYYIYEINNKINIILTPSSVKLSFVIVPVLVAIVVLEGIISVFITSPLVFFICILFSRKMPPTTPSPTVACRDNYYDEVEVYEQATFIIFCFFMLIFFCQFVYVLRSSMYEPRTVDNINWIAKVTNFSGIAKVVAGAVLLLTQPKSCLCQGGCRNVHASNTYPYLLIVLGFVLSCRASQYRRRGRYMRLREARAALLQEANNERETHQSYDNENSRMIPTTIATPILSNHTNVDSDTLMAERGPDYDDSAILASNAVRIDINNQEEEEEYFIENPDFDEEN